MKFTVDDEIIGAEFTRSFMEDPEIKDMVYYRVMGKEYLHKYSGDEPIGIIAYVYGVKNASLDLEYAKAHQEVVFYSRMVEKLNFISRCIMTSNKNGIIEYLIEAENEMWLEDAIESFMRSYPPQAYGSGMMECQDEMPTRYTARVYRYESCD
jgi:hypothetical protein